MSRIILRCLTRIVLLEQNGSSPHFTVSGWVRTQAIRI